MKSKLRGVLIAEFEFIVGEPFTFPCVLNERPDWLTMVDDDQGRSVCIYVTNQLGLLNPIRDNLRKFSGNESPEIDSKDPVDPSISVCPLFNHANDEMGTSAKVTITQAEQDKNCILIGVDSVPIAVVNFFNVLTEHKTHDTLGIERVQQRRSVIGKIQARRPHDDVLN
ncbi:MAG: hypothetical protein AAF244_01585, partial [Pseudomonadota bacterium]